MINLFQFAPRDQSLYYLARVFGNVGTVLPIQGDVPLLLSVMFRTFNSIILAVAVLVIVYITIVGVMKTAGEGAFLGKNWNSLWVPIRIVLGVAALVPAPSGYSGIQIIIMWVIVQGIGAADTIWSTAVNYLQVAGSPYAGVQIPYAGTSDSMSKLWQSMVCSATSQLPYAHPTNPNSPVGGYYCGSDSLTKNDSFCRKDIGNLASNSQCAGQSCVMNMGPDTGIQGACGTLIYCNQATTGACSDPSSLKCTACKAQNQALTDIVPAFATIAKAFAEADYNYRRFYSAGGPKPNWVSSWCRAKDISETQCCKTFTISLPGVTLPPSACRIDQTYSDGNIGDLNKTVASAMIWPYVLQQSATVNGVNFLEVSISNYTKGITEPVSQQIGNMAASQNVTLSPQLQQARDTGWIFAGAYYYYIAQMNNNNLKDANPTFTVSVPEGSDPSLQLGGTLFNKRTNYTVASDLLDYVTAVLQTTAGGFSGSAPPKLQKLSSKVFSAQSGIFDSFMNTVSGGDSATGSTTDPLAKIQSLGEGILLTIEILFGVLIILVFGLALAGNIDIFALGTGAIDPIGPTLATILLFLVPVILGFMGTFMGIGGTLAVYVPLVPYMIFTFGAIGWFIATIEAMVAAPIVALGIMTPSGQHDVLGKAEGALMLIFSIFLRPSLMIFGLMAAMLLSSAVVTMVNASFETVMLQITAYQLGGGAGTLAGQTEGSGGGGVDLLELIFFMAAYVMLVVTVLNKCFALIHLLPDRALRWIGHHGGEEGAPHLEEVKAGVGAAAGAAKGAATGAPSTAAKGGKYASKESREARKKGKTELKPDESKEGE